MAVESVKIVPRRGERSSQLFAFSITGVRYLRSTIGRFKRLCGCVSSLVLVYIHIAPSRGAVCPKVLLGAGVIYPNRHIKFSLKLYSPMDLWACMEINYVFAIGRRCNATIFLNHYVLRIYSSPFDWTIIDFETSIENIKTNFKKYLNDIVIYRKNKMKRLIYSNNEINPFFKEMDGLDIGYMALNWNDQTLRLNQNYLPTGRSGNLYTWDRICLFVHPLVEDEVHRNKVRSRIGNFNMVFDKHHDTTLFFYISEIIEVADIERRKMEFVNIVNKYEMTNPFFIVLTVGEDIEARVERVGNVWFCTIPVPSYESQFSAGFDENNLGALDFDKVYSLLKQTFDINIIKRPS